MRGYKNNAMRTVNLLHYLCGCFLLGTGLTLTLRLPPGTGGQLAVLGLSRHEWGDLHFYVALFITALVLAHLALNWAWMRKIAAGRNRWRLLGGLAAGAVVVLVPLLAPMGSAAPGSGRHGNTTAAVATR
jgi:hypothetical protein